MSDTDSLKIVMLQLKVDSLEKISETQFLNFIAESEKTQIGKSYFTDILSHQWTLLSIQTAIFLGIITIIIALMSFVAWKTIINPYRDRLQNVETTLKEVENVKQKIVYYDKEFERTRMNALRALYEGIVIPEWKFIHHIRYCEWFYDHKSPDLKVRIKTAEQELNALKSEGGKFQFVKTFDNVSGLHTILKKIIQSKDKEISLTANRILSELLT